MVSYKDIMTEAMRQTRTERGEVSFASSSLNDPHVQKMIEYVASKTDKSESELFIQATNKEMELRTLYQKADRMTAELQKNLADNVVHDLLQEVEIDNMVDGVKLFSPLVFKRLCMLVMAENNAFFPLKNPFQPRAAEPRFFVWPEQAEDLKKYNERVYNSAQGCETAFCTIDADMVFSSAFMKRMNYMALMKGVKTDSKKYVSNGGEIPDHYCYIETLVAHELMHFSTGDLFYIQYDKNLSKKNAKLMNWADDFINNFTLVKSGYAQLPIGLFSDEFNFDRYEDYDEIVAELQKEMDKLNEKDKNDMNDQMDQETDDHEESQENSGDEEQQDGDSGGQSGEGEQQDGKQQDGKQQDGDGGDSSSGGEEQGDEQQSDSSSSGDSDDSEGEEQSGDSKSSDSSSSDSSDSGGESGEQDDSTDGLGGDEDLRKKIKEAQKKSTEAMEKREDGEDDYDKAIGKKSEEEIESDLKDTINKVSLDTKQINMDEVRLEPRLSWEQIIKKMVPSGKQKEDSYSKMSRSSTSTMLVAKQTGRGAIKPGQIKIDSDKKALVFIIDNSGSVMDILSEFNKDVMLLIEKNSKLLENMFVIKFSGKANGLSVYHVDVKNKTYVEIRDYRELFKSSGKVKKIKTSTNEKHIRELFKSTFAGGTDMSQELVKLAQMFIKNKANIILFTDDDLARGEENIQNTRKLLGMAKRNMAVLITNNQDYNNFCKVFGQKMFISHF